MKVVFRTDASLDIGTGHVMRCLALADALTANGASCRFVSREHDGNLIGFIGQRGYPVHALPCTSIDLTAPLTGADGWPAHLAWLGATWQADAQASLDALGCEVFDWMIVDHYGLDICWEQAMSAAYQQLMAIDDLADRRHECSVLLDQNLGRQPTDYLALLPSTCQVFTGPHHALLRPAFAARRQASLQRRAQPALRHLVITMGGVDKDNATGRVLDQLKGSCLPHDCRVTIVMGPHAPWLASVRAQAAGLAWQHEVRVNVQDMAELMMDSDLVIGAAGSTSWERCVLGVPSILVVQAENQQQIADALSASGAAIVMDQLDLSVQLGPVLMRLGASPAMLARMSAAAAQVTNGQGAKLIVDHLVDRMSP